MTETRRDETIEMHPTTHLPGAGPDGDRTVTAGSPGALTGRGSPRRAFVEGARAMLPWLVGVVPLGMVVGMTASTTGRSTGFGLTTGLLIYSGSAQLTAIELVADGAAVGVVVASVLMINARLLMYGSSMAPHWRGTSRRFRVAAAYLLVDPSFAEGDRRYRSGAGDGHWFYIGTGMTLWVAWQAAIIVGSVGGALVPAAARLEHVLPLYLLAELAGVARVRSTLAAAIVGGVVGLVAVGLPMHSGMLVAIVVGVVAGMGTDRSRS